MQRPKPNVVKAAERKEILTSQEKFGAHVEKSEDESCVVVSRLILITFIEQVYMSYCKSFVLLK
jgi:hypothetical protein